MTASGSSPQGHRSSKARAAPQRVAAVTSESFSIVTWAPVDLSKALVVIGLPSLGLVGNIAAGYLVESLRLKEVGYVISPVLPPTAVIDNGISASPIRVFLGDVVCGPDGSCERLCVIQSFVVPPPGVTTALAHALVSWVKQHGARQLVWFEGVKGNASLGAEPRVTGVASDDTGRHMLEMLKIAPSPDGLLVGSGAVGVYVARAQSQPAICFFAEAREDFPDARAAAWLLETLQPLIPIVKIDDRPLLERAEVLEGLYRSQAERSKETVQRLSENADMMFG